MCVVSDHILLSNCDSTVHMWTMQRYKTFILVSYSLSQSQSSSVFFIFFTVIIFPSSHFPFLHSQIKNTLFVTNLSYIIVYYTSTI